MKCCAFTAFLIYDLATFLVEDHAVSRGGQL